MKTILILMAIGILASCGGGGGSKSGPATPTYSIEYFYPENPLLPGQGSIEVEPTGAICKDSSGNTVDDELCPELADFDPLTAPKHPYESPAGFITVNIENSLEGDIQVPVETGIDWSNIEDAIRRNKLENLVTCSTGFTQNFRGDCVVQGFSYTYGEWPVNTLAPCTGSQVFTRTYICIDDVSGVSVDYSFCSDYGITPDTNRTYLSPIGNGTMAGTKGDLLNISCQEGKTQHDLGVGTVVTSVASCGSQRHLALPTDLTCTPNSYIASDVQYPVNDMEAGTGSRTVTATSFNECRTSHDNTLVDMSYCSGINLSSLTETQLSPAGTITETTPEGDSISYTYTEGGTKASPETVVVVNSCAEGRHVSGSSCHPNTYYGEQPIFPANDLLAGQGSREVSATGYAVCKTDHDDAEVDPSFCSSLDASIHKEIQLSPAGFIEVNVPNADPNPVSVPVAEGVDYEELDEAVKVSMISGVLTCIPTYSVVDGQCLPPYEKATLVYKSINAFPVGSSRSYTPTITNTDDVTITCSTSDTLPIGLSLDPSTCTISGTTSQTGDYTINVVVSSTKDSVVLGDTESTLMIKVGTLVTAGPNIPVAMRFVHTAQLPNGDSIFIGTESGASNKAFLVNSSTGDIKQVGNMTYSAYFGCLMPTGDGRIIHIGGASSASNSFNSTSIYNPETETWTAGPTLPAQKTEHTCQALDDGRVLVALGEAGTTPTATAYVLNASATAFTAVANSPHSGALPRSAKLQDGKVVVAGGITGMSSSRKISVFDPSTNTWSSYSDMPVVRYNGHRMTVLDSGDLIIFGHDGVQTGVEIRVGGTRMIPPASPVSLSHSVTIPLEGNKLLTVGGSNTTMYIFDRNTNTWSTAGTIPTKTETAGLVPLTNGRYLFVGGRTTNATTNTNKTYIIDTNFL